MFHRIAEWWRRLRSYRQRSTHEARLAEELRFHTERAAEDLVAAGHDPGEAARVAVRSLGRTSGIAEEVREAWGFRQFDRLIQDLRYAGRSLRREPAFTAIAVAILGLGIGALTAVFSVANTVLFRPMPVAEPATLVWLVGLRAETSRPRSLSLTEISRVAEQTEAFRGVTAYQDIPLSLGGSGGPPSRITGLIVSGNYFDVLGVAPALGRGFRPAEDSAGAPGVMVLSHRFWTRRFGADPGALGRSWEINGRSFTVIGVAPPGFVGAELESVPDVWVPLWHHQALVPTAGPDHPGSWWLRAVGRLARDQDGAQAAVALAHGRVAAEFPKIYEHTALTVRPLRGGIDPPDRSEAVMLVSLFLAIPGLVLLVACANVANLLLGRAAARRREMGIRVAVGAGRGRLVRQLLTESAGLGIAGGIVGLVLAVVATPVALRLVEVPPELADAVRIDWRVLGFTALVSLLASLGFGLAPALGSATPAVTGMLRGEFGTGPGRGRSGTRLMSALVIGEVAVSLVLLVVSGLIIRSLGKTLAIDPGFTPTGVVAASFDLALQGYGPERREAFYRTALDRAAVLPGVTAVSIATYLPLGDRQRTTQLVAAGGRDEDAVRSGLTMARPGLLEALGIDLRAGRDLSDLDQPGAPTVALVNATLAGRLWPNQDPLGKVMRTPGDSGRYTVIGVIGDGKYQSLTEDPISYVVVAERQWQPGEEVQLVVRAGDRAVTIAPELRRILGTIDPNLPLLRIEPLTALIHRRVDALRSGTRTLAGFGALALGLAALGVYGVMAFATTRRTREIGIRMALGAGPTRLVAELVAEGARLAGLGVAIGLVLSVVAGRLLGSFLYGVGAVDLVTFAGAALVLLTVGVLASYLPARRGARIDPTITLRTD